MRQTLGGGVAKNHRLHTTKDCRKCHAERQQQNGRCPGLLFHGGGGNPKFTPKDSEPPPPPHLTRPHQTTPAHLGSESIYTLAVFLQCRVSPLHHCTHHRRNS